MKQGPTPPQRGSDAEETPQGTEKGKETAPRQQPQQQAGTPPPDVGTDPVTGSTGDGAVCPLPQKKKDTHPHRNAGQDAGPNSGTDTNSSSNTNEVATENAHTNSSSEPASRDTNNTNTIRNTSDTHSNETDAETRTSANRDTNTNNTHTNRSANSTHANTSNTNTNSSSNTNGVTTENAHTNSSSEPANRDTNNTNTNRNTSDTHTNRGDAGPNSGTDTNSSPNTNAHTNSSSEPASNTHTNRSADSTHASGDPKTGTSANINNNNTNSTQADDSGTDPNMASRSPHTSAAETPRADPLMKNGAGKGGFPPFFSAREADFLRGIPPPFLDNFFVREQLFSSLSRFVVPSPLVPLPSPVPPSSLAPPVGATPPPPYPHGPLANATPTSSHHRPPFKKNDAPQERGGRNGAGWERAGGQVGPEGRHPPFEKKNAPEGKEGKVAGWERVGGTIDPEGLTTGRAVIPEGMAPFLKKMKEEKGVRVGGRVTLQWGFFFQSTTEEIVVAGPPPFFVKEWVEGVAREAGYPGKVNQYLVNFYDHRQGIFPHVDDERFGEAVLIISVEGRTEMVFTRGKEEVRYRVPAGSWALMKGDARHNWKHGIPPDCTKGRRISVTLRYYDPRARPQPATGFRFYTHHPPTPLVNTTPHQVAERSGPFCPLSCNESKKHTSRTRPSARNDAASTPGAPTTQGAQKGQQGSEDKDAAATGTRENAPGAQQAPKGRNNAPSTPAPPTARRNPADGKGPSETASTPAGAKGSATTTEDREPTPREDARERNTAHSADAPTGTTKDEDTAPSEATNTPTGTPKEATAQQDHRTRGNAPKDQSQDMAQPSRTQPSARNDAASTPEAPTTQEAQQGSEDKDAAATGTRENAPGAQQAPKGRNTAPSTPAPPTARRNPEDGKGPSEATNTPAGTKGSATTTKDKEPTSREEARERNTAHSEDAPTGTTKDKDTTPKEATNTPARTPKEATAQQDPRNRGSAPKDQGQNKAPPTAGTWDAPKQPRAPSGTARRPSTPDAQGDEAKAPEAPESTHGTWRGTDDKNAAAPGTQTGDPSETTGTPTRAKNGDPKATTGGRNTSKATGNHEGGTTGRSTTQEARETEDSVREPGGSATEGGRTQENDPRGRQGNKDSAPGSATTQEAREIKLGTQGPNTTDTRERLGNESAHNATDAKDSATTDARRGQEDKDSVPSIAQGNKNGTAETQGDQDGATSTTTRRTPETEGSAPSTGNAQETRDTERTTDAPCPTQGPPGTRGAKDSATDTQTRHPEGQHPEYPDHSKNGTNSAANARKTQGSKDGTTTRKTLKAQGARDSAAQRDPRGEGTPSVPTGGKSGALRSQSRGEAPPSTPGYPESAGSQWNTKGQGRDDALPAYVDKKVGPGLYLRMVATPAGEDQEPERKTARATGWEGWVPGAEVEGSGGVEEGRDGRRLAPANPVAKKAGASRKRTNAKGRGGGKGTNKGKARKQPEQGAWRAEGVRGEQPWEESLSPGGQVQTSRYRGRGADTNWWALWWLAVAMWLVGVPSWAHEAASRRSPSHTGRAPSRGGKPGGKHRKPMWQPGWLVRVWLLVCFLGLESFFLIRPLADQGAAVFFNCAYFTPFLLLNVNILAFAFFRGERSWPTLPPFLFFFPLSGGRPVSATRRRARARKREGPPRVVRMRRGKSWMRRRRPGDGPRRKEPHAPAVRSWVGWALVTGFIVWAPELCTDVSPLVAPIWVDRRLLPAKRMDTRRTTRRSGVKVGRPPRPTAWEGWLGLWWCWFVLHGVGAWLGGLPMLLLRGVSLMALGLVWALESSALTARTPALASRIRRTYAWWKGRGGKSDPPIEQPEAGANCEAEVDGAVRIPGGSLSGGGIPDGEGPPNQEGDQAQKKTWECKVGGCAWRFDSWQKRRKHLNEVHKGAIKVEEADKMGIGICVVCNAATARGKQRCQDCDPSSMQYRRVKVGCTSKSVSEVLKALKLQKMPTERDGNCMFHALAAVLRPAGTNLEHGQVREIVATHLEREGDRYSGFCDGDWKAYLEKVRSPGSWGDHLCLAAASEALGVTILVVRGGSAPVLQIGGYTHLRSRFVAVAYDGSHYECVFGEDEQLARLYDEARTVKLQRGGVQPADAKDQDIGDDMMDRVYPAKGGLLDRRALGEQPCRFCPVATCQFSKVKGGKPIVSSKVWLEHLDDHLADSSLQPHVLRRLGVIQCPVCAIPIFQETRAHGECLKKLEGRDEPKEWPKTPSRAELPSMDDIAHMRVPLQRAVPIACQALWGTALKVTMNRAVQENSTEAWLLMAMLPKACLGKRKGGKKHKQANGDSMKKKLRRWIEGDFVELWRELKPMRSSGPPVCDEESKVARATTLCSMGRFSAGNAALVAEGLAEDTADTYDALLSKHPGPAEFWNDFGAPRDVEAITADKVLEALRSFPRGSAAGPTGLSAQHLKDAVDGVVETTGALTALTGLLNKLACGRVPLEVAPLFAGANLVALKKNDKDVRPIAVGEALRRLTGKVLVRKIGPTVASAYLGPGGQVGVAIPSGMEAAIHTIRRYTEREKGGAGPKVIVKIDYANAFNSVLRKQLCKQAYEQAPGLHAWTEWCYRQPSNLYYNGKVIASQRGVQQGDPLGPLLFSLAIQPLVDDLRKQHRLDICQFYLDDGVLAGDVDEVKKAYEMLVERSAEVGLQVKPQKCELIWVSGPCPETAEAAGFNGIQAENFHKEGNFMLLGAPIGTPEFTNAFLHKRIDKLEENFRMLRKCGRQTGYTLTRYCSSYGKLVFYMRTVPETHVGDAMQRFDELVRGTLEHLCGVSLEVGSREWKQAKLSVRMGGLGMRSCHEHVRVANMASLAAAAQLCKSLDENYDETLRSEKWIGWLNWFNKLLGDGMLTPDLIEANPDLCRQRWLSRVVDEVAYDELFLGESSVEMKARLLSQSLDYAGAWLTATPSHFNKFTDDEFMTLVRWWLGMDLYEGDSNCRSCGRQMDCQGDHAQQCGPAMISRHNKLRDCFARHCSWGGVDAKKELRGLVAGTEQRPADVFLQSGVVSGYPAAVDFTVVHSRAPSYVNGAAKTPGYAAMKAEAKKRALYEQTLAEQRIEFHPFAVETFGGFGWEAVSLMKKLARCIAVRTHSDRIAVQRRMVEDMSVGYMRDIADSLLGAGVLIRPPPDDGGGGGEETGTGTPTDDDNGNTDNNANANANATDINMDSFGTFANTEAEETIGMEVDAEAEDKELVSSWRGRARPTAREELRYRVQAISVSPVRGMRVQQPQAQPQQQESAKPKVELEVVRPLIDPAAVEGYREELNKEVARMQVAAYAPMLRASHSPEFPEDGVIKQPIAPALPVAHPKPQVPQAGPQATELTSPGPVFAPHPVRGTQAPPNDPELGREGSIMEVDSTTDPAPEMDATAGQSHATGAEGNITSPAPITPRRVSMVPPHLAHLVDREIVKAPEILKAPTSEKEIAEAFIGHVVANGGAPQGYRNHGVPIEIVPIPSYAREKVEALDLGKRDKGLLWCARRLSSNLTLECGCNGIVPLEFPERETWSGMWAIVAKASQGVCGCRGRGALAKATVRCDGRVVSLEKFVRWYSDGREKSLAPPLPPAETVITVEAGPHVFYIAEGARPRRDHVSDQVREHLSGLEPAVMSTDKVSTFRGGTRLEVPLEEYLAKLSPRSGFGTSYVFEAANPDAPVWGDENLSDSRFVNYRNNVQIKTEINGLAVTTEVGRGAVAGQEEFKIAVAKALSALDPNNNSPKLNSVKVLARQQGSWNWLQVQVFMAATGLPPRAQQKGRGRRGTGDQERGRPLGKGAKGAKTSGPKGRYDPLA